MKLLLVILIATFVLAEALDTAVPADSHRALREQNDTLFHELKEIRGLTDAQINSIRAIFEHSGYIGQGNPDVTRHPITPQQCQAKLAEQGIRYENPRFEKICGGKYLAPLYDPATERPEDAQVCIDQFEFPDIPCAYPVVWVKAREAAEICWAEGERLPDAHEWEGACEGDLKPPDYRFDLARGLSPNAAVERMRADHNRVYSATKRWSYGPEYQRGICAASSVKTAGCNGGSWTGCGSNTFPGGDFPACHSPLDVYDLTAMRLST